MNGLLLGVDGGNTKTAAVVVDRGGAVLGAGGAGCGDIHNGASPEPALVEMAGHYWDMSSKYSEAELGYRSREGSVTIADTIAWLRQPGPVRAIP